jgi:hypothetical protein
MLPRRVAGQSGARARFRAVNPEEWRYKVRPECLGKAQEAVAQMRALGFRVELRRGDLLVFTIEHTVIDDRAGATLERVWPNWRECVTE